MPTPSADVDGTLVIVVLKARNLSDKRFYKQDVYTVVSLASTTDKTPIDVKGGQNPLWDHELRFLVPSNPSEANRTLELACWCKQSREDDLIAKGKLDISETLRTGEFDDWIPLIEPSGQQRGDIYVEMTFFSNAPPPPAPPPKADKKPVHGPHYSAQISEDINARLQRRPTKLLPAERLQRPPASLIPNRPQAQVSHAPFLAPASAYHPQSSSQHSSHGYDGRSASHSPPSSTSRLPQATVPQQHQAHSGPPTPLPSILLPGSSYMNNNHSSNGAPGHRRVSSEGRSGNPATTFVTPDFEHRAELQSSFQPSIPIPTATPYASGLPHSHTHAYPSPAYPSPHSSPPTQHSTHYHPGTSPPNPVMQPHFPIPSFTPSSPAPPLHAQYYPYNHNHSTGQTQSRDASALPDPYLIARYQSPLPLPPGVPSSPGYPSPASIPMPAVSHTPPIARPYGNHDASPHTPPLQRSSYPAHPSTPELPGAFPSATHPVDASRVEAQRREEETLRQKKEQEEKDMELARRLDMELNLGSDT